MVKGEVDVFSEKEELDGGYQSFLNFWKNSFHSKDIQVWILVILWFLTAC